MANVDAKADLHGYLRGARETLVWKLARWRKMLFSFLAHNSRPPTTFFQLPPNRVVELGLQIEL